MTPGRVTFDSAGVRVSNIDYEIIVIKPLLIIVGLSDPLPKIPYYPRRQSLYISNNSNSDVP